MRHDLKECGKRIQQFRQGMNLSQEELAEKLNVSQNTIAKIEWGLPKRQVQAVLQPCHAAVSQRTPAGFYAGGYQSRDDTGVSW